MLLSITGYSWLKGTKYLKIDLTRNQPAIHSIVIQLFDGSTADLPLQVPKIQLLLVLMVVRVRVDVSHSPHLLPAAVVCPPVTRPIALVFGSAFFFSMSWYWPHANLLLHWKIKKLSVDRCAIATIIYGVKCPCFGRAREKRKSKEKSVNVQWYMYDVCVCVCKGIYWKIENGSRHNGASASITVLTLHMPGLGYRWLHTSENTPPPGCDADHSVQCNRVMLHTDTCVVWMRIIWRCTLFIQCDLMVCKRVNCYNGIVC